MNLTYERVFQIVLRNPRVARWVITSGLVVAYYFAVNEFFHVQEASPSAVTIALLAAPSLLAAAVFLILAQELTGRSWKNDSQAFVVVVATAGLLLGLVWFFLSPSDKPPEQVARPLDAVDAIGLCQDAIRLVAKDPDSVEAPYVEPKEYRDAFDVTWSRQTKLARMNNGLGLSVPAEVSCRVDRATRRIIYLKLNDDVLIQS